MNRLILISALALATCLSFQQLTFAVCTEGPPDTFTCDTNPPNPDLNGIQVFGANGFNINVLPGAGVDTRVENGGSGGTALGTGSGNDRVDINNGSVAGQASGIDTSGGEDEIVVNGSTVIAEIADGVDTSSADDMVTVNNSTVRGGINGVDTGAGLDVVRVNDSSISGDQNGIFTQSNDDQVTIVRSIVRGDTSAINTSSNDDTIELGTGADIRGLIDCGSDFDTIVFSMEVPVEQLTTLSGEIAVAGTPNGSITINGLNYEWEGCEQLVNELVGVRITRPIPTLSEWGLIAMAGIIGLAGFIAIRKKYAVN